VLACRNPERAANAVDDIRSSVPGAQLDLQQLNLASLESVRTAAGDLKARYDRIDLLVNNAGVMYTDRELTAEGFELQFGTNHLGHFALTALLLPGLLSADAARIVTVTSTAHRIGRPIDPANPHLAGKRYGPWKAYGQSKLANYFFALGLDQRLKAAGAPAISLMAHPGLSDSDLQSTSVSATGGGFSQRFFHWLARTTGMSEERGALPQLRASLDPKAAGGQFYAPRFVNFGSPVRRPVLRRFRLQQHIDDLWQVSERETAITLDVAAALTRV
jgi:NAD(P)-dependent dehydrogenase (short-subunit alcohol dehydrogenase family)